MRRFCFSFAILFSVIAGGTAGRAQSGTAVSQIRPAEPFKIQAGSSFSASTNHSPLVRPTAIDTQREKVLADFEQALRLVRDNHIGGRSLKTGDLTKSAISAMLRTLDPHSSFYDADEYRTLQDEQRSEYSGIGSTIVNYTADGSLETYIVATNPKGAASLAGLQYGDRIVAVDGESMSGYRSDVVRDKIRGPGGTTVRVTVERAATGVTEVLSLRRALISQPSLADAYILRPGIGYIDLTNGFNYTTSDELDTAMRQLRRDGMTSLVIDLRGNPGGILDQAVRVAEKFLPAGSVIVSQRGRYRIDNRVWRSGNRSPESLPLVLLVDESSASASEVVAGAFQDHDRALIVGEKTFGKGLVQSVLNLPAGAGLTLTTARYLTPSGRSIQRDYSNGSLYEYYNHKDSGPRHTVSSKTDSNRVVYGGDGIAPDEMIKTPSLTEDQTRQLDPLFLFSIKAIYGRIIGLENYSIVQGFRRAAFGDLAVGGDAILKYRAFAGPTAQAASDRFIASRLRYNFVTAQSGSTIANRVLIQDDPQVARAIELLPRAAELARAPR